MSIGRFLRFRVARVEPEPETQRSYPAFSPGRYLRPGWRPETLPDLASTTFCGWTWTSTRPTAGTWTAVYLHRHAAKSFRHLTPEDVVARQKRGHERVKPTLACLRAVCSAAILGIDVRERSQGVPIEVFNLLLGAAVTRTPLHLQTCRSFLSRQSSWTLHSVTHPKSGRWVQVQSSCTGDHLQRAEV